MIVREPTPLVLDPGGVEDGIQLVESRFVRICAVPSRKPEWGI